MVVSKLMMYLDALVPLLQRKDCEEVFDLNAQLETCFSGL